MSSSDFTFKQAEKLLEELKIITPTLDELLKSAIVIKETNERAILLNEQIEQNLKTYDEYLRAAICGELDRRLGQLDQLNELESRLNRNIAYLKKSAENSKVTKSFTCLFIGSVAGIVTYLFIKTQF